MLLAIVISLQGCASPQRAWEARKYDPRVKITALHDEFKKITIYSTEDLSGSKLQYLGLRAIKSDGTNLTAYQIYAVSSYSGAWRFYESAFDSNGIALAMTKIARKVNDCGRYDCYFSEHIGIVVSRAYLEKASLLSEIRFKLSGTGGDDIFNLQGIYIKEFLESIP